MTCLTILSWGNVTPTASIWTAIGPCTDDTTPPTITSANPSGSYPENSPISATLAADEAVTWSVSGTDAGFITLNSITGAWLITSVPDYETKNSYTWLFTATDHSGNTTDQVVSITITDVVEVTGIGEAMGLLLALTKAA